MTCVKIRDEKYGVQDPGILIYFFFKLKHYCYFFKTKFQQGIARSCSANAIVVHSSDSDATDFNDTELNLSEAEYDGESLPINVDVSPLKILHNKKYK